MNATNALSNGAYTDVHTCTSRANVSRTGQNAWRIQDPYCSAASRPPLLIRDT